MPLLAKLFEGFFTGLVAFLAQYIGKKGALAAIVIAGFVALLVALWAAIAAAVAGLAVVTPTGGIFHYFWIGFFLLMPDNWIPCMSACLTVDTAVFLYRFKMNRIAPPVVS